jgi:hypothetical protein
MPRSLSAAGRALVLAAALASAAPGAAAQSDPGLAAEVEAAAVQLRAQLPMQVDDLTTAVGIRADGAEFVYDMVVNDTVPREAFRSMRDAVQTANQTNLCAQESIATFIRRGGSMRHIYTNAAGDRFETRVTRCP